MIRAILLMSLFLAAPGIGYAQQPEDDRLYIVKDTVITGVDTINLIHTKLKLGLKSRKKFSFLVGPADTILYSLQKENNTRMKYRVIMPGDEQKEYPLHEDVKNEWLNTDAGGGNYIFEFRNQSFRKNHVIIDLKKVQGWKRKEKIKIDPPREDSVVVVINDTVPRLVLEGTYYIGSKKNIRAGNEKLIEFEFAGDSIPCYWAYIAGFGKEYGNTINTQIDLKTQQPVGDPLVAWFMKGHDLFPYSESKRAKLNLNGPDVNKHFKTTAFGLYRGKGGVYKLAVINNDEVVGEYLYVRVVAFDLVRKSEVKIPLSQSKKMKIAPCSKK